LILLPDGGLVIDTPGMRELQLPGGADGVDTVFDDIEQLARQCRFADCAHVTEPGCAVREAVDDGRLDPDRLENYFKLKKEQDYLQEREVKESRQIEKEKWRQIKLEVRRMKKTGRI
jgi:ribosome biogenesis GTPase